MSSQPGRATPSREIRCKGCRVLLAMVDESGLTIRRGDLQATVEGGSRTSIVCYRPRCRTLNVVHAQREQVAPTM